MKVSKCTKLACILLVSYNVFSAGPFDLFNSSTKFFGKTKIAQAVSGKVSFFYDADESTSEDSVTTESDRLTAVMKELHKDYDMKIVSLNKYIDSYVGEHNKNTRKPHSRITHYNDITFRKIDDHYRLTYLPLKASSYTFIDLPIKYNKMIDELFTDLSRKAHFVTVEGHTNYIRGGLHLMAKNLPKAKSLSLLCKQEIYLDGSGGNSCRTDANVDISKATVFINNDSNTIVPADKLKDWEKHYNNNSL